jgi:thioredoxin:protein disulfide reductase
MIACPALAASDEFLPPEKAFALTAQVQSKQSVRLQWQIADGYYLYQERIQITSDEPSMALGAIAMPQAVEKFDANFDKTMRVYKHSLTVDVPITNGAAKLPLHVSYQGCAEKGLCYPPVMADLEVKFASLGAVSDEVIIKLPTDSFATGLANAQSVAQVGNAAVKTNLEQKPTLAQVNTAQAATDSIASTLASGSLVKTAAVFLVAGLLLAFTPCVLPMVPILSSLIAGQSGIVTRSKGFFLALAYALGMALMYAGFGVAAGLAGEGLAAALQNPWVLGVFALLLCGMALSMFGVYELQLPSSIQTRANNLSNKFQGGSYIGVFLMGSLSALIVGPCVAAPLAGALVYISHTRDVVLGGLALFSMAMGMSVPLLLAHLQVHCSRVRVCGWSV